MDGIKESARKYTEHDLINAHAQLPEFPELRSRALTAFLKYATSTAPHPKLQEAIALAVSLMQHGLDTHELVDGGGEPRRRQMTVLAGDYFSSRFYQLLSQAESVQAIGLVSQAVCEVNRLKMNVYLKAKRLLLTAEEYVRSTVDINTHLFLTFGSWMDEVYRKSCPAVLRAMAECELIAGELGRLRPDGAANGWAYWYVVENGTAEEVELLVKGKLDASRWQALLLKYNLIGRLTDRWETSLAELRSLLRTVGSDKLAEELQRLAEPLFALRQPTRAREI
ncbi:heptaprenyl diphosphate synthase component 1 [Paenibacillus sp.]|uniref:heptaprenyl diphosphate synthase component 1 n=1 Tax=Paenibacillus sp. TaxID=58172 RepID=UPI002D685CC0|nr:heptaprenyl diphosphate synthase component 1 [Paenibacillus sp.]HZG57468.1 heptaprenyl diphosphate synthase component 1 [Paenibacillus sp.]